MKILHITKKYPPAIGGDAFYVCNIKRQQQAKGHEVFILTANTITPIDKSTIFTFGIEDHSENWDRITFKRLISTFLYFIRLPFILRRIKPDIVHIHAVELGCFGSWWARIFRIPVVLTCHSTLFPYKDAVFIKRLLDFLFLFFGIFDKVITVDAASVSYFGKYHLTPPVFIPVGVNLEEFIQDKVQASRKNIRFLFVGRLEKVKGLDSLLRAAKLLMYSCSDFEIYLVGDGSNRAILERLSEDLGLNQVVRFIGPVTDRRKLVEIYRSVDIFVLPSLRECCPLVIFEAWAAGLALIATATGSIPTICQHDENAYLIPPNDVTILASAMANLCSNDDMRMRLANNGQRIVQQRYAWTVLNDVLERLYEEILGR